MNECSSFGKYGIYRIDADDLSDGLILVSPGISPDNNEYRDAETMYESCLREILIPDHKQYGWFIESDTEPLIRLAAQHGFALAAPTRSGDYNMYACRSRKELTAFMTRIGEPNASIGFVPMSKRESK